MVSTGFPQIVDDVDSVEENFHDEYYTGYEDPRLIQDIVNFEASSWQAMERRIERLVGYIMNRLHQPGIAEACGSESFLDYMTNVCQVFELEKKGRTEEALDRAERLADKVRRRYLEASSPAPLMYWVGYN